MPTNKRVKKINAQLNKIEQVVEKYEKAFAQAGGATEEEQQIIANLREKIQRGHQQVAELAPELLDDRLHETQAVNEETESDPPVLEKHKGSYNYAEFAADLFRRGSADTNKIDPNDVQQGFLGDCYFLAAIASVARADPSALEKLIKDNGNGTYDVTLYVDRGFLGFGRAPKVITVSPEFPLQADGTPAYARGGDRELWVMLLEKAYAQHNGSFEAIKGGRVDLGIGVITGTDATSYATKDYSEADILAMLTEALNDNKPVVADSKDIPDDNTEKALLAKSLDIIEGHSYPVKAVNGNNISLQNPWSNASGNRDITISVSDFRKYYNDFNIQ